MFDTLKPFLVEELQNLVQAGLFKTERILTSPQGSEIRLNSGQEVVNFCSNNYLGLSSNSSVIEAAQQTIDTHGFGLSSVRFICGTQDIHKQLEKRLSDFLGTDDTILYAAAFDANGGVFEPLFSDKDVIISDELNHASIIDGVRLCKAERQRYSHGDMVDLASKLASSVGKRHRIIVTDGVFSMDGTAAKLDEVVLLAEKYKALVMVDDCHATGFVGKTGRGTHELHGVMGKIDILTGTLGKALGGASGGFISGRKEIIALLRQRSRPYLFSNTLAPSIVGASLKVLDILWDDPSLRDRLAENAVYFRRRMKQAGFDIPAGDHPIVPIMVYEAKLAQEFAEQLLEKGIYVIGFYYPVVPAGKARIRVQLSALHTKKQIDHAIQSFVEVGERLGVISPA